MCNCNNKISDAAKTMVNGVIGITKALTHVDDADQKRILARRDICRQCEHKEFNKLTRTYHCSICKCCLKFKTQIESESCPLKKW